MAGYGQNIGKQIFGEFLCYHAFYEKGVSILEEDRFMLKYGKTVHNIILGQAQLRLLHLGLGILLLFALVAGAYAQSSATFTGKVATTGTQVTNGKFEIVLRLAEHPDYVFYISLEDAPKYGLTNDKEIKSGAEFGQFMGNLDALQGQTVKLSCVKIDSRGPNYRVKALDRVSGK